VPGQVGMKDLTTRVRKKPKNVKEGVGSKKKRK